HPDARGRSRWRPTRGRPGDAAVPTRRPRRRVRPRPRAPGSGAGKAADPGRSSCRRTPIKVVLGDVLHDTIGDQVPHREAPADSFTALRRGDGEGGDFERAYASLGQSANVEGMSWA